MVIQLVKENYFGTRYIFIWFGLFICCLNERLTDTLEGHSIEEVYPVLDMEE